MCVNFPVYWFGSKEFLHEGVKCHLTELEIKVERTARITRFSIPEEGVVKELGAICLRVGDHIQVALKIVQAIKDIEPEYEVISAKNMDPRVEETAQMDLMPESVVKEEIKMFLLVPHNLEIRNRSILAINAVGDEVVAQFEYQSPPTPPVSSDLCFVSEDGEVSFFPSGDRADTCVMS